MKNTMKNALLVISLIANFFAAIIIVEKQDRIDNLESIINGYNNYKTENTKKQEPKVIKIDTLDLMMTIYVQLGDLQQNILVSNFDSYIKNSPRVIKNLEKLISITNNKKSLVALNKILNTVKGRPTNNEISQAVNMMCTYWEKSREDYKRRSKNEFYKNKL